MPAIDNLIPILTCGDLEKIREELRARTGYFVRF